MTITVIGDNTGDDYSGTEDTYLRSNDATTNNGTDTNAGVSDDYYGQVYVGLISFSGLSNISATDTVNSATMSLHRAEAIQGTAPMACEVFRLKRNWVETEATYNEYATSSSWQSAGAAGANDIDTTASSSPSFDNTDDYQDVTGLGTDTQDFVDGTESNYGWKVAGNESNDRWWYVTSDGTDGERPYLTVDHDAAAGGTGKSNPLHGPLGGPLYGPVF